MKRLISFALVAVLLLTAGIVAAQSDDAYLGILYAPARNADGIVVREVLPDSPADAAGLQVGDVITAVDGETITRDHFAALVQAKGVGDELVLTITRDGESLDITVTLAERPATFSQDFDFMPGNRPYLGIGLEDLDGQVSVREVVPESAAAAAGLQAGDVITALNGEAVTSAQELVAKIQGLTPGDEVTLSVTRGEETLEITATLGEQPGFRFNPGRGMDRGGNGRQPFGDMIPFDGGTMPMFPMIGVHMGAEIVQLNEQIAQEYNVAQTEGLYVVRVQTDSPAAEAGLQARDIITAINGQAITADFNLFDSLNSMQGGDVITLDVLRGDETVQIEITLEDVSFRFFGGRGMPNFPDIKPPLEPTPEEKSASL